MGRQPQPVSLSDSNQGVVLPLECVRSFLLVSPDSQYTFEPVCVLSRLSARVARVRAICLRARSS
jgi:hypothetical protein